MKADLRYTPNGQIYPLDHDFWVEVVPQNHAWGSVPAEIPNSYWTNSNVYFTTTSYSFKGSSGSGISGTWIYQN